VGSGTGIFSRLLLAAGAEVWAVEPNAAMRAAAETTLGGDPRFHSVAASAEDTTLPDGSMDLVVAAQALHWFDMEAARAEFARILRPRGKVAVVFNNRRDRSTSFLAEYEGLLHRFATDYANVDHRKLDRGRLLGFYRGGFEVRTFPHVQELDWEGLRGRLLSASYAPAPGHPDHEPMLEALRRLFEEHAEDGRVRIEYDAEVYVGEVPSSR
jgi:SAM-dependent methyltransferase